MCLRIPGAATPAALVATWGEAIATGCAEASLGHFEALLGEMAGAFARRRPPLPFDLARRLAVLRDGPRAEAEGPEGGAPARLGVPMRDAAWSLRHVSLSTQ